MEIFEYAWAALLVTFFGSLFLLGEIFVKARGIFGVIGMLLIAFYFSFYTDTNMFILLLVLYITGMALIVIDGKILNDGILASIGFIIMIASVGVAAPTLTTGAYGVLGVVTGSALSFVFLKFLKPRNMWSKITLRDQLTSEKGYNSINMAYKELVGQIGVAKTDLRPVGTIMIDDAPYSAISAGNWIQKGTEIVVVSVDGTKIQVEEK